MNDDLRERLLSRVAPEPTFGCWLWLGSTDSSGYGTIRVDGRTRSTHRLSYELHRGAIPDGLLVCHKCDVPSCVNPDHFFLGTDADNARDRDEKGRLVPAPPQPGEMNPNAKLSDAEVVEMRRRVASRQTTARDEAERFGVHYVNICAILRGDKYGHLPFARPKRATWKRRRLSSREVEEIRARYARGGVTLVQLAARHGASRSNVQRICADIHPEDPRCE